MSKVTTVFYGFVISKNKCEKKEKKYDLEEERVVVKDQDVNLARQFSNCSFIQTSAIKVYMDLWNTLYRPRSRL
jgi:hypothetical protein